jgi:Rod binding domain-containing protein
MVSITSAYSSQISDIYSAPNAQQNTKDLQKAQEVAEEFEAFFLSKSMESMFEGVSTDGLLGGGHAEKIYRSMLINEYGKAMAQTGTVGVSDEIMSSIMKLQEAQSAM